MSNKNPSSSAISMELPKKNTLKNLRKSKPPVGQPTAAIKLIKKVTNGIAKSKPLYLRVKRAFLKNVKEPNLQQYQPQELLGKSTNNVVPSQSCIVKSVENQQTLPAQLIKPVIVKRRPPPPGFVERITTGGCRIAVLASQLNVCSNTHCQTKNFSTGPFEIVTPRNTSLKSVGTPIASSTPKALEFSICKKAQNTNALKTVALNKTNVEKSEIIQSNNTSRMLTRSLSRTQHAEMTMQSNLEEHSYSTKVKQTLTTSISTSFIKKKSQTLNDKEADYAQINIQSVKENHVNNFAGSYNNLIHTLTTENKNSVEHTISSNTNVTAAIAKIVSLKQCSISKIKRQPPPGYFIVESPDGPSIAKPAPKMLEATTEETAQSVKPCQKRKIQEVSEAGPSDKLPKLINETPSKNLEQQSTEPSADDLFNKLIELEKSFFSGDYKTELTTSDDDTILPKWHTTASNLTPLVEINSSTENLTKLNKSPIYISSSDEDSNKASFSAFTSSKAGKSFNKCNKENFKKFSQNEKYIQIDSDEDEIVFDPDYESDECVDSDEDLPNSKLLDSIYNASLLNRQQIFRTLRNVCCPSHRDPHFFYKQNEKSLEHVFDSLNNAPTETELAADPEGLVVPLMKHQKHALSWMQFCEKRRPYGGLLADDMGLGKTLTVLALIMNEKNRLENGDEDDNDEWSTSCGGTLVICPASLLRQWENEANTKFNFTLMPLIFHGNVHKQDIDKLRSFDVVITTYESIINARLAKHLFNIKWRRIVLDEAHIIRNPVTQKSESVCQLRAKYRWALTGTPIHNKETDVFSILKFLRYTPFDDRAFWSSWSTDHQRLSVLLRSIMLRRTKLELQKQNVIFKLPPRTEEVMNIELSEEEMNVHQAVLSFSKVLVEQYILQSEQRKANQSLGTYIARRQDNTTPTSKDYIEFVKKIHGDVKHIGQHVILVLLLRPTQICCHPGLAKAMLFDDEYDSNDTKSIFSDIKIQKDLKITQANTTFFNTLKKDEEDTKADPEESNNTKEPTVREILSHKNQVFNHANPSSKMLEVMRVLKQRVINNKDKAVIVSQWTGYLSIIENYLNSEGINVLSFTGKMTLEERENALIEFNCSVGHAKVLLLSLKCGGVGLNLTAANHLILMDLHWNPQMETQAQDRIYRLGQKKPVYVYKFLCQGTIEERIKMVQDDKLKLAENVLTGASALKQGLRFSIRDLKKLFGIGEVVNN